MAFGFCGFDNADAGAACDLINNVRTFIEHGLCQLLTFRRIAKGICVGDFHINIGVDGFGTLDVTDNELIDARSLKTTNNTDNWRSIDALDGGIGGHLRGQSTGQV